MLAQHLVGRRRLQADVQRYQGVVLPPAGGQLPFAAANDLGIGALGQADLVFDQLHHGLARGQKVDGGEPVFPEYRRRLTGHAQQRIVVGTGGIQHVQPLRVMLLQQRTPTLGKVKARGKVGLRRQPPRQKVTAQRHAYLAVVGDLSVGMLQLDLRIYEAALQKRRLRPHDGLRSLAVAAGDLVIVGHALVHLCQLLVQVSRPAVEHHQHRRRPKGPPAPTADSDSRAGHLCAGAAVQAAHGADVVVAEKALNEVTFPQQVAPLPGREGRMLRYGLQQQRLHCHHPGNLSPGK